MTSRSSRTPLSHFLLLLPELVSHPSPLSLPDACFLLTRPSVSRRRPGFALLATVHGKGPGRMLVTYPLVYRGLCGNCKTFVELMSVDKEAKIAVEDDELNADGPTTRGNEDDDDADEANPSPPGTPTPTSKPCVPTSNGPTQWPWQEAQGGQYPGWQEEASSIQLAASQKRPPS
jgi:hypothetical protein